jgi:phytanoyl-CoA hydroxylase
MKLILTPGGLPVEVPEVLSEDSTKRFSFDEIEEAGKYYKENGYVIIAKLFQEDVCNKVMSEWVESIKKYGGYVYRRVNGKAEKNVFNNAGWVMNPVINPQSLDSKNFKNFRSLITNDVLCCHRLQEFFKKLIGSEPKVTQSLYFEGNESTPEHQDSFFVDSEDEGEMVGAWIALEDIDSDAGRFFLCPKSHLLNLKFDYSSQKTEENNIRYLEEIVNSIRSKKYQIIAPCLNKGDVIFWGSKTIHGSLEGISSTNSRSSITCHAISFSKKILKLQAIKKRIDSEVVNGYHIARPKDLDETLNRMIFYIETKCPKVFYYIKLRGIQILQRIKYLTLK